MSVEDDDPNPDVHALFVYYSYKYFNDQLGSVSVIWSKRMTLCAGLCEYRGGMCTIKLSEPLLKFRPRSDTVNTLLHEMIHAYLFVTHSNTDRDDHGPLFLSIASRINEEEGSTITIYHSFHDEVEHHRKHWWMCAKCGTVIKRAMNREPSPNDRWWADHAAKCGGRFEKIKEPEGQEKKRRKKVEKPRTKPTQGNIESFLVQENATTKLVNEKGVEKELLGKIGDEFVDCPVCGRSSSPEIEFRGHLKTALTVQKLFRSRQTCHRGRA